MQTINPILPASTNFAKVSKNICKQYQKDIDKLNNNSFVIHEKYPYLCDMMITFLYSLLLSFLPLSAAAGDINVCCQESAYGGIIADISTGRNVQPRLYSGKELDRTNNLWWYDFLARPYDPTRGQFTGPDQLSEKYYPWNPFTFCLNNPLKFEDDDGKSALKRGIKFIYGVGKAVTRQIFCKNIIIIIRKHILIMAAPIHIP